MALIAYPMESNYLGNDAYGNPVFDRAVGSVFYRTFWSKYFTDGVFFEPADNFLVSPAGGMKISVKLGECHIRGVTASPDDETELIITLDNSLPDADRTDRIVLRADFEGERLVYAAVRKDWKSADTLTRNANIWELALADVVVKAGSSAVEGVNISDLRLNTELCGIVAEPIIRTNTQEFFNGLSYELERVKDEWEAQKDAQQDVWAGQLETQESDFRALEGALLAWYGEVRADISRLQNFDFDNIAFLAGCTRSTVFSEGGSVISEVISVTASGKSVAKRVTRFDGGTITTNVTVYDTDGETVLWETLNTCVMGEEITETLTDGVVG